MNFVFEFLPLILFLVVFSIKDIYAALIALMIAMPIGLIIKRYRTGEWDKMYLWSTVFLLVAGALTLYFRNPEFLYWKPTVFYWVVAVAFLVSQFVGDKPLVQRFFGLVEDVEFKGLERMHWLRLNLVWVVFFVFSGMLNLYVAYNYEEATWVKFKVFGLMALTFVFMLVQTLWLARYMDDGKEQKEEG